MTDITKNPFPNVACDAEEEVFAVLKSQQLTPISQLKGDDCNKPGDMVILIDSDGRPDVEDRGCRLGRFERNIEYDGNYADGLGNRCVVKALCTDKEMTMTWTANETARVDTSGLNLDKCVCIRWHRPATGGNP